MAFTFGALVAYDPNTSVFAKNASFQAYATTDTAFATPLAITNASGGAFSPANTLNSGLMGVLPQFQQASNSVVVLRDSTGTYVWTVVSVPAPDATTTAKGVVQLAGDLGGTAAAPSVLKVNGVTVSGTPTNGQVITASSGTAAAWATPAVPAPVYPSGWWGVLQTGPDASQAADTNQYFYPFWTSGGTVTAAGIWVDTASTAGVTLQLSAYSLNSAGTFTNLFNFGTYALSTAGFVSITATNTLPSGFWFLGVKGSAASGSYHATQSGSLAPVAFTNSTNGPSTTGNSQGRYGGSIGNTALSTTVGGTTTPGATAYATLGATIPPPKIFVQFQ